MNKDCECNTACDDCIEAYRSWRQNCISKAEATQFCLRCIQQASEACENEKRPFVVTLDECDRLHRGSDPEKMRRRKVPAEDSAELQVMKGIFTALKDCKLAFCFITGVLPLLMKELSGVTNNVTSLTHDKRFAGAIGLSHETVKGRLQQIAKKIYTDSEPDVTSAFVSRIFDFMKLDFNGFCFTDPDPNGTGRAGDFAVSMFNSQQVKTFFGWLASEKTDALETLDAIERDLNENGESRHIYRLEKMLGVGLDDYT